MPKYKEPPKEVCKIRIEGVWINCDSIKNAKALEAYGLRVAYYDLREEKQPKKQKSPKKPQDGLKQNKGSHQGRKKPENSPDEASVVDSGIKKTI